jgi:Uma2 family endonuclease
MADNTRQWDAIVYLKKAFDLFFADRPDVFVAGNHLWYPVEGHPEIRQGPDVMIAFGRPKGHRGSYRQWDEYGVAPQVVFEVLSPGNRFGEMQRKLRFYEQYGVEEYFIYDPDDGTFEGYQRQGSTLVPIPNPLAWVSPRLGVRFELVGQELRVLGPDGGPFPTVEELAALAVRERERAEAEAQRAEQERRAKETALSENERLRERLRALGIDPDASPG